MKKWSGDLHKLIYTHILLIGIPTIFYYCLRLGGLSLVDVHMAIATFFLISSFMIIVEATNALFRRSASQKQHPATGPIDHVMRQVKQTLRLGGSNHTDSTSPPPKSAFLIAAYLPNEQDIILDTVRHLLNTVQRPPAGIELILAYNTPFNLPIEDDLRLLAEVYPELKLLRVEGSHSKAENLNAALDIVTGEVTCILDADHHPQPDCLYRAWRWLERGHDVVQGRNIVRNHAANLLTQNIAVEFESLYGVSHPAKSFLTNSTIFGGSNGYWHTAALKRIRFNPAMLTEDIDATMRTLLSGYRIIHDRSIISTELAPENFDSFWFQRKRWAQGWLEVSLKYQRRVWKSEKFSLWQKVYWTYLLYYCMVYSVVALQILPLALSLILLQPSLPPAENPYIWFSTVMTFGSGIYQTLVTMRVMSIRYPLLYFIQYAVLIFPYTILKNMITLVGLYDHLRGHSQWVVTPRSSPRTRAVRSPSSVLRAATLGSSK